MKIQKRIILNNNYEYIDYLNEPQKNNTLTSNKISTTNIPMKTEDVYTFTAYSEGRKLYNIKCSPCHSYNRDGLGIISRYALIQAKNMTKLNKSYIESEQFINTIKYGKGLMPMHGKRIMESAIKDIGIYIILNNILQER
ncbi:MAG: cytochrome c [Verrucomicrobia bacterium]|nr:cytochrome c [Verrucomicrobiota bacterium]